MKMRLAWLGVVELVLLVGRSEAGSCSAHAGLPPRPVKTGEGKSSARVAEGHLTILQCPLTPKENINWFWDASDFPDLRKPNIEASFGEYWEWWRHVESWTKKKQPLFHLGPDWPDGNDCAKDERLSDGRVYVLRSDRSLIIRWAMPPDTKFLCMEGAEPANATASAHFFDVTIAGCTDARSGKAVPETCSGSENECRYEYEETPMRKVSCTCGAKRTGEFCQTVLHKLWFFPLVSTIILLYYGAFLTIAAIRPMRLERVSLEDVGGADAERISVVKFLEAESQVPLFHPSMITNDEDSEKSDDNVEVKVDEKGATTGSPDKTTGKSSTPSKILPKVDGSIHVRAAPTEGRLYTTSPAPTYKDAEAVHLTSTNPEPLKSTCKTRDTSQK